MIVSICIYIIYLYTNYYYTYFIIINNIENRLKLTNCSFVFKKHVVSQPITTKNSNYNEMNDVNKALHCNPNYEMNRI